MANSEKVGVIGAGVMGEALIAALIKSGFPATSIAISEKRIERRDELLSKYKVSSLDLADLVGSSSIILLVIKPQDMENLLGELKPSLKSSTLIVSFVAGKKISFITERVGSDQPVIRVMPNTPTLVGQGMSAITLGKNGSLDQSDFVGKFLESTGKVIEVDEDLQDAVTATSGSGPAYFFAFVEAMIDGAKKLGLSESDATTLTIQTMVGAAKLLEESGDSPSTLREKVTSPNGTTAAALASFGESGLTKIVAKAMEAAKNRSQELA